MRYLGGKSKIAKRLAAVIGGGDLLIEPFVGGGAMTAALAPSFREVRAYDIHLDLILLWNALKSGWLPPHVVSEHEYAKLRDSEPSALRAFVGFAGASWGGKWFGGYARGGARNYADEAARSLARDIALMGNVSFAQADYRNLNPPPGAIVYADPPYAGTTGYGRAFDNTEFWEVMTNWAQICHVYVSEYKAPATWDCVWSLERTRDMKAHMTDAVKIRECLFFKGKEWKEVA